MSDSEILMEFLEVDPKRDIAPTKTPPNTPAESLRNSPEPSGERSNQSVEKPPNTGDKLQLAVTSSAKESPAVSESSVKENLQQVTSSDKNISV